VTSEKSEGSAWVLMLALVENKLVDWVKLEEAELVALVLVEVLALVLELVALVLAEVLALVLLVLVLGSWGWVLAGIPWESMIASSCATKGLKVELVSVMFRNAQDGICVDDGVGRGKLETSTAAQFTVQSDHFTNVRF